ncbi:hypothetical protein PoB_006150000 [Plakobranchus ocellatus]|uniref:Uncharacterized protein n=1 Tax=Plakobranchus ocellatus TaxID=259542 RepID=A0AAV4CSV5_9GAST|nr:hypothetical protein PoB_006150000 [Plakobranchus ocellatus]
MRRQIIRTRKRRRKARTGYKDKKVEKKGGTCHKDKERRDAKADHKDRGEERKAGTGHEDKEEEEKCGGRL